MSANVPAGLDVTTTQNFHQVITVITVITAILTTIVVGGSIILASILGVVSVFQNTKGMIYWFQLTMIFLMLAQAVLALQGFFHLMAYRVNEEM